MVWVVGTPGKRGIDGVCDCWVADGDSIGLKSVPCLEIRNPILIRYHKRTAAEK